MLALDTIIFLSILLFPQPNTCVQPGEELIQQYLEMDLEGRIVPLLVPRRFTEDAADRVQGASHAQFFRLDTTTFEPVSRKEAGARMDQGRIDYLNLLLSDFIDLDRQLRTRFKGFKPTEYDACTKDFLFKSHESGFNIVVGELAPSNQELFFIGLKDSPEIVAQCKTAERLNYPICSVFFDAYGLELNMTIDKREFGRWKELRAGVDRFLSCITTL